MSRTLTALVLGGGSAGVRHFRYLTELGIACSVCDPADTCRVTREFPDVAHFRRFDEVDLSEFDVVVICTPPVCHIPQAIAAARAGCHLLVEKPLSVLSANGIDELEALVRQRNLVAAVAFPYANMQAMDRIIEIVRAGEIGAIRSVQAHHGQNILKYRPDYFDVYYCREDQGGGLQDDAVHPLMGLEMLLGAEREITCQRHRLIADNGNAATADDTVWLWIRYPNHVVATVDFSFSCHWKHNEWIISGSLGAIQFLVSESTIHVFQSANDEVREETFSDTWDETFRANDHSFIDAIRSGTPVRCTIAMARTNLRAILAARESARTGQAITIEQG